VIGRLGIGASSATEERAVATDRAEHRGNAPKARVLWVSESPRLHTGHGRVADEITKRLAASGRFELGVLGWSVEPQGKLGKLGTVTYFSRDAAAHLCYRAYATSRPTAEDR
jgi:hypothetical protein